MRKLAAGLGRTGLAARIVAVAALTAATVGLAATPAGAAPAPVTDYASYPEPLPAGCPDGAAALTGVQFDNGRGDTASDLRNLPVRAGDTVTMSWDGFAANCAAPDGTPAITVGLAVYDTETLHFDHTRDEQLLPGWVICGANAGACPRNGGRYAVSVDVPSAAEPDGSCYVQIDAILGLPLAVVGPNGSYYNNLLRGGLRPQPVGVGVELRHPLPAGPGPGHSADHSLDHSADHTADRADDALHRTGCGSPANRRCAGRASGPRRAGTR